MPEFGFETNPETQLAPFGLTDGFIESLSPEDLRGVLSAIAKYAAVSRHPDRFMSSRVDYSFGNTDARTLTSIAGRFVQLSNEEVSEVQEAYSEVAVVKEYRDHLLNLSQQVEDQKEELNAVKARGLELLVPDESAETINNFSGMLFCRRDAITANVAVLEVEKGGKVKTVSDVSPLDKEFLKDAERWAQDAYRIAQTATDKENPGAVFIVSSAKGAKLRVGSSEVIDLSAAGIDPPLPDNRRKPNVPQLYLITDSINKKTGKFDKPVFVTYSLSGKKFSVPVDARILGFMDSKQLYDFSPEKTINLPHGLGKSLAPPMSTEQILRVLKQVSISKFWTSVLADKQVFSRSLESSSGFVPILYGPSNRDDCMALGSYYMAARD